MKSSVLSELSHNIEELVASTRQSVVAVEHGRGQGSGVVIADDGYVLTNAHVVPGREPGLRVRFADGEELRADVVGRDVASDLAVLRVASGGLSALELHEDRRVRVGQIVVAVGNPLRFEHSVSLGVVSAIDRTLPVAEGRPFEGLIQTDAAINPGSSGGPLLDAEGCVAGINTAVIPFARGIGFAVPAHTANWVVAVLLKKGRVLRPLIGIAARGVELGRRNAASGGSSRAIYVESVASGSPALRAGVRAEDLLLTANGQPLASVNDLQRVLVLSEGAALTLELLRQQARLTVTVRPELRRDAA